MIQAFLSQIAAEPGAGVLLTYGPMGVLLLWFMYRDGKIVPEIRSLSHRIDGLTRALLMDMVNRDSTGPATRAAAQAEIAKIEERLTKA